jgi:hypothetical protein
LIKKDLIDFLLKKKLKEIEENQIARKIRALFPYINPKSRVDREIEIDRAEAKRLRFNEKC